MSEFLVDQYLWLKAVHVIFVITWMAGLLYLPRLFVYHCQVGFESEAAQKFEVMERRLLRVIINPSGVVVFATGILLIIVTKAGAPGTGHWMHAKLLFVLGLGAAHGMMAKFRKQFERGENERSEWFYRLFNEVPTVLMIVIVVLVVVKPV